MRMGGEYLMGMSPFGVMKFEGPMELVTSEMN